MSAARRVFLWAFYIFLLLHVGEESLAGFPEDPPRGEAVERVDAGRRGGLLLQADGCLDREERLVRDHEEIDAAVPRVDLEGEDPAGY